MKKVELQALICERSDVKQLKDNLETLGTYLVQGYQIKEKCNAEYVILEKDSKAIAYFKDENGKSDSFNIKEFILEYYDIEELTKETIEMLKNEVTEGKFEFYINDNDLIIKPE